MVRAYAVVPARKALLVVSGTIVPSVTLTTSICNGANGSCTSDSPVLSALSMISDDGAAGSEVSAIFLPALAKMTSFVVSLANATPKLLIRIHKGKFF